MADQIDYAIIGDDLQAVIVTLDPGEAVVAEAGAMMYMQDGNVICQKDSFLCAARGIDGDNR